MVETNRGTKEKHRMNRFGIVFKGIMSIIIGIIVVSLICAIFLLYKFGKIQIRPDKHYAQMYVYEDDIVDGDAIISPPMQYSQLLQIDLEMRKRVAEYMDKNNYKLKGGEQEFIRVNPSFEELIEDGFQFEKIDDN